MDTLELAQQLIREPSITPEDGACQSILAARLEKMGFSITHYPFSNVKNLWARRGKSAPLLVFCGHTDVVPPGPLDAWQYPPFEPTIVDGKLFGRGAADMKSGVAAMVCAAEKFVSKYPNHSGSIAFLITSDEEGDAIDGTQKVLANLPPSDRAIDYCIVGEATSDQQFGDTIKNGRRGSLSAKLTIHGKQGHIAYPQLAENPIHRSFMALHTMSQISWDNGDEHFQPTSLQFSNIHSGTGAGNVIPGKLEAHFNLRYSPKQTAEKIKERIETILKDQQLKYDILWTHGAEPFITHPGELTQALSNAIKNTTGISPQLSTTGGTSDGRFISKTGAQVIEFGVINQSIHQVNENTIVNDLTQLTEIFIKTLESLLLS
ncbi:MAG: succinyl-diaminopimelate desuccinylase [Gammaproteobacteria bacterium]|nr:succinyl-diaminopimelate desuccinylase [Gammaproteobacteria bacterium]